MALKTQNFMLRSWPRSTMNEDTEFGLDAPPSEIHEPDMSNVAGAPQPLKSVEIGSYGAVPGKDGHSKMSGMQETGTKAYNKIQQIFVFVAGVWMLFFIVQRLLGVFSAATSSSVANGGSPSPSPELLSKPTCAKYKYPQCEAALQWYLSRNAANRCEAFEHVRAEGDFFRFPYSTNKQDMCDIGKPGCCGCKGQCSKCPPLFAECSSWRFDGSWQVAFGDGSQARYTFDAHGHYEMEISTSSLPVTWKAYDHAFIPAGSDILDPQWLTVKEGQSVCRKEPQCKGITYDESSLTGSDVYFVYLKSISTIAPGPGTGWKTYVETQRPELHNNAAVAGPLSRIQSDKPGTFRLNLHKAAPQLFPSGSFEKVRISHDELVIERHYPGLEKQMGHGVRRK